jgi:hypothetical protein
LPQNLFAVSYEEHAAIFGAGRVKCGEEGLAQSGSEYDKAGGITFCTRSAKRVERTVLNEVRFGWWWRRLGRDACLAVSRNSSLSIGLNELRGETPDVRVVEKVVESLASDSEGFPRGISCSSKVPFDSLSERRPTQIGAANYRDAGPLEVRKEIGLGMKGRIRGVEEPSAYAVGILSSEV